MRYHGPATIAIVSALFLVLSLLGCIGGSMLPIWLIRNETATMCSLVWAARDRRGRLPRAGPQ
jgi:hypothetical protein